MRGFWSFDILFTKVETRGDRPFWKARLANLSLKRRVLARGVTEGGATMWTPKRRRGPFPAGLLLRPP
jgi:hypothetical protein